VKTDQIGTEHPLEDFLVPREETEHIVWWEWDVEEESDPRFGHPLSNQSGQEEEMIVMDPELIVRAESTHHRVREPRVDGAIRLPFGGRIPRVRREGVKQRPQCPIRKATVVRAGQIVRQDDRIAIELLFQASGDLLGFAGGDRTGPSEPATSQFSMNGCEARRDPAGIRLNVEAVPDAPNGDRETVRDQDKSHFRSEPLMHPMAA